MSNTKTFIYKGVPVNIQDCDPSRILHMDSPFIWEAKPEIGHICCPKVGNQGWKNEEDAAIAARREIDEFVESEFFVFVKTSNRQQFQLILNCALEIQELFDGGEGAEIWIRPDRENNQTQISIEGYCRTLIVMKHLERKGAFKWGTVEAIAL